MQHAILLLPLIGIVVFFIFPPEIAIPVYLVILAISGILYWFIIRVMMKQPNMGREGLIGMEGRVVSKLEPKPGEEARYMIRIRGELWRANSQEELFPGDIIEIVAVNGLILDIRKKNS